MSIPHVDVIIVGGGPGGATAALRLADSGLKVVVLEKATFPRDKICGDALSGKVVSVLKYTRPELVDELYQFQPKLGSWGIRFISPNRTTLDIPFKLDRSGMTHAPGFISKRVDFDEFLWRQLANFDHIETYQGEAVTEIKRSRDHAWVKTTSREWTCSVVIGADGAHSVVNKQLGQIKVEKNHYCAGIRAYYAGVSGFHEENFIELQFLQELLPGYFWIFPLPNGRANVGLGMLSRDVSRHKVNLKERLKEVVASHPELAPRFKDARLEGKITGFGLPLGSKKRPISGDKFMLVGDAASLIDPFSGEGIGNAMLSGKIAAETILNLRDSDFTAEDLRVYDQAVYKKIWQELAISRKMQQLVNYPWLFNFIARKANRNEALRSMMTMMFDNLDIRKELSKPGFYWKLFTGR
ncbi:MAG: geranylgeranyl reductase family protein [Bacteroidota bacterium]